MTSDATPAYRGYRLQHLYTLWRILTSEQENIIFQQEGQEDLAVLDSCGNLLEVLQVKAYSDDLVLSTFSPNKADSFFYRIASLVKAMPHLNSSIVSFGPVGPELLLALEEDGSDRQKVAKKLSNYKFISQENADHLLQIIRLISVEESDLTEKVFTLLHQSLMGTDPENAFDLLSFWLYRCAEKKSSLTQQDVIKKVNSVGQFLAERAAHHREWFTSITPIEDHPIETQRETLANAFFRGVSAQYNHILADLDVPRPNKLQEIVRKCKEHNVVIIHGASGQGKSTLAYRYLREYAPNHWRFQVHSIDGREHALSIARALHGHANAMDIPLTVYIDISPRDYGWVDLIEQLSHYQNISVLVTIREEDFRRVVISKADIQLETVTLTLECTEAELIYQRLGETRPSTRFLNFQDAWSIFGSEGPLMEFVYLVTQGETLRERLKAQVKRLEDDILAQRYPSSMLELLRLVSVASAYEAQIKVKPLVESLQLVTPGRVLELLEEEYLIRRNEEKTLLQGLHPIRSMILAELLTTPPAIDTWSESVCACLPLCYEPDVEGFLLHAFSRRQQECSILLSSLASYQPLQWTVLAGIMRALLWLGIRDYAETNQRLIQEVAERNGSSWYVILDSDIADAMPGLTKSRWDNLGYLLSSERRRQIQAFQARQSDKKQVFAAAKAWLSRQRLQPAAPVSESDWASLAELLFWVGYFGVQWPLEEWVAPLDLGQAIDALPLTILADLVFGIWSSYRQTIPAWLENCRLRLLDRFQRETQTVKVDLDGTTVTAHFIIPFEVLEMSSSQGTKEEEATKDRFHDETMRRIHFLRRIFPDQDAYASQGYGHRLLEALALHDSTYKTGIPRRSLPPSYLTAVNATFRGRAQHALRSSNWQDYTKCVLQLRRAVLQALQQVEQGLEIYFRKQKPIHIFGLSVNATHWSHCQQLLRTSPLLPICALDEWGFVDEDASDEAKQEGLSKWKGGGLVFQEYRPFLTAFLEYTRTLSNFFGNEQSVLVMKINAALEKRENSKTERMRLAEQAIAAGRNADAFHLSTMHLGDGVETLIRFQREFRRLLAPFCVLSELDELEQQEKRVFPLLWQVWHFFAFHPNLTMSNAMQECAKKTKAKQKLVRKELKKFFQRLVEEGLDINTISTEVEWNHQPTLWLTVDTKQPIDAYRSGEFVIAAMHRATHTVKDMLIRRYALNFPYTNVLIVPLIQGKSLTSQAWRVFLPGLLVSDSNESQAPLFPQLLPPSLLGLLNIETWVLPQIEVAKQLWENLVVLSLLAAHLRDIQKLPSQLNEQEVAYIQPHIDRTSARISNTLQLVLNAETVLAERWETLSPEELTYQPSIVQARKLLCELHTCVLPSAGFQGEVKMRLDEVAEWAQRLETGREHAFFIYLFYATDVLKEEKS
ncbi:MAG TPA: hypothetical protein VGL94_20685 [Ktedonobacteraceae bacterium]